MTRNGRTPPKVEALNTTKLKNQQQQEKIESILFLFAERKQKVAVIFKDV